MKKILITGGCGFIGSNLVNFLIKKNYKIYNIDKISTVSTPEKFKILKNKKNYKFYKINLLNKKKVNKIFFKIKPDFIINLAAESHVDRSIDNPSFFLENNILSSTNLFEIFKNFSKIYKKSVFIQISTDEVFGSVSSGSSKETGYYNPSSPYASSKASADLIAMSFVKTYKIPIKILNLCNNFGPYQFLEKYIPMVIFSLIKNIKAPIYGNGMNIREWMFVEDTCEAIYKILRMNIKYKRLNIGSNLRINNIQLANIIFNILKQKKLTFLNKKNFIRFIKNRPGHDTRYAINSNLFYKRTKFKIINNIKTGIEKTIEWYLKNKGWVNFQKKKYSNKRIGLDGK
jgi:dTDP-glucose 4,6-dehydratase